MTDLRTLRKRLGLTQTQLAELLQTSQQTISEQETGKVLLKRERVWALQYLAGLNERNRNIEISTILKS